MLFDYIQTFAVDRVQTNNAGTVGLRGISLYFKSKPAITGNRSGIRSPGVTIGICPCLANGDPDPTNIIAGSMMNINYTDITTSSLAQHVTEVLFPSLIFVLTGKYYGIVIKYQDPDFKIWTSVQGEKLVGTNTPSPGPSSTGDGFLFEKTNTNTFRKLATQDLKFAVTVAKYTLSGNSTITLVPKDYEFMNYTTRSGTFIGGEFVYQDTANSTGTVRSNTASLSLIGSGTTFAASSLVNNYIVITNGTDFDIRKVLEVTNSTLLFIDSKPTFNAASAAYKIAPVAKVYQTSYPQYFICLVDSTSNSSVKFATGNNIYGELSNASANISNIFNYSVDQFNPEISITTPANFSSNIKYAFSYLSGSNYIVNNSLTDTLRNDDIVEIEKYDGFIMSRSNEVANPDYLYSNTSLKKSGYITVEFSSTGSNTNLFETPKVDSKKIDIFAFQNKINNSAADEHTNFGNAISKWISTKVSFATDRLAEDLKVYLTAYKPAGTDLKIYAKIHNSKDNQPFDDKQWTLLNAELNAGKYSSSSNTDDYIDISFGIPQYPRSNNTLSGFCTVTADSNTLSTTSDLSSSIAANSLIKIYNPGVPLNYFISPVSSVTSSTVVLANPAPSAGGANNNVIGSGFKIDVLAPKNTAFNNYLTDNVVRYYSSSMVQYDNFDTFSIKIVMLSNSTFIVPRVQDIRAIGV